MQANAVIDTIRARLRAGMKTRILAFGSSNTERILPMHWFDVFDLAVGNTHGRIHHCINTGVGGHTSGDLLVRFEEDARFYSPHAVIVTIGGNDSNPQRAMTEAQFASNLRELHSRFCRMGTAVVFQTYYAPVPELLAPEHVRRFGRCMAIVREVAAETRSGLVDHLVRWEHLREHHRDRYLPLMQDGLHLNRRGNLVMGLDLARRFDVRPTIPYAGSAHDPEAVTFWDEAVAIQALMDRMPIPATASAEAQP